MKAFDPKFGYELRSREPMALRDAFKGALSFGNNRKVAAKNGMRDEVQILQNQKGHQGKKLNEEDKPKYDLSNDELHNNDVTSKRQHHATFEKHVFSDSEAYVVGRINVKI